MLKLTFALRAKHTRATLTMRKLADAHELKAFVKAQSMLFLAMQSPSVRTLREAIACALAAGVAGMELNKAQAALLKEEFREQARQQLKEAQDKSTTWWA